MILKPNLRSDIPSLFLNRFLEGSHQAWPILKGRQFHTIVRRPGSRGLQGPCLEEAGILRSLLGADIAQVQVI